MKILLIHNTCAEYRVKWFQRIAEIADTVFLFTSDFVYADKYGFSSKKQIDINATFLSKGVKGYKELVNIVKSIADYDFIMLPTVDSFREFLIANIINHKCKKLNIKSGYFWEKWEAPIEIQPVTRVIKNRILCASAATIFRNVDIVFAGGSKSREYFLQHGVTDGHITILPDCSEVPDCIYVDIRQRHNIPKEKKLILYFGRLMDQKGLDILIKAVKALDDSYFLLVIGDGDFREYCEKLAGGINNILFVGAVEPQNRKNYFEQCDLFVFPGTFRGGRVDVWGLTLNEAVEARKPVISTDAVGSAYDLIDDGENGYRIAPENVEVLKEAIIKAFQLDKEKIKRCNSKKMEKYNFYNMANVLVERIFELIE